MHIVYLYILLAATLLYSYLYQAPSKDWKQILQIQNSSRILLVYKLQVSKSFIFLTQHIMQQATKKANRDKLETQIKLTYDHDPDIVEEAAKHITKMITEANIDLKLPENQDIAKRITNKFLEGVGSQNFQVHSTVMRCLAEVVPFLPKDLVLHVFKVTISSIVDQNTQLKKRQVFCSAAGEMIERAPADIGDNISGLFVECVIQCLRLHNRKNTKDQQQTIIHLLNIIISFSAKWPDVVGNKQVKYDRQGLIKILLNNVEKHPKLELVLKSIVALEKIAGIFDRDNFEFAFNSKQVGLLTYIHEHQKYTDESNLKHLKNGVVALDHIVRAHNREMKPWAREIAILNVDIIRQYKNLNVNSETHQSLFLVTEIIEGAIDCLTSVLRAYSSQLSEWLGTGKYKYLSDFVEQTLNYDPENMMNYLNLQQQDQYEQEEQQYYYSQGSVCWKVREASLVYVTMLMRKDHQFKEKKAKQPQFVDLLSKKLIQENQNVSKNAFACFNFIIQSISTTKMMKETQEEFVMKRVKSNEGNFAVDLVEKIAQKIKILFNHKKTKEQAKTQASKTLLNIIQLLNEIIKDYQGTCSKILDLIQDLLPKVKSDSCINLIKSSKTLMNGNLPFAKIQNMIDAYLKLSKNSNFKVSAASFDGLRNVIKYYHHDLLKTGKINVILDVIIPKLKQHSADKLIKTHSIRCLGPIFSHILVNLPENVQNDILSAAETKLKVEIDKTTILSQISQIPQNYKITKSQQGIFKSMTELCSDSIGTANYQLNNQAVECCNKLIELQGRSINDKLVDQILNKGRTMLNDGKIPKYMGILIENYPNSVKAYAEIVTKTGETHYILKMLEKKIINVENCVQILKSIATPDNAKKLSLIVSKINPKKESLLKQVNESNWGLVCLGALGYVGDLQTIDQINALIINHKSHDFKFEGARAIGNIVSRNTQYSLKLIEMSGHPVNGYLYLQAIKDMLSFSHKTFPELQKIIHFIFQKSQESQRETNKHLLAQCIGSVSKISPFQLKRILQSVAQMSANRKFIVASSLRYALQPTDTTTQQIQDDQVQNYIDSIINLSKDKEVNVREGALKSLNSIVNTHLDRFRQSLDSSFMNNLLDSMTIKAELIKIVDYGVSKEKKDLGKPLRIEAFNFLRSIINIRQIQDYYDAILAKCLQKLNEESSNDLILKRVNIIRLICEKDFTLFTPYQNDFATKLGTTEGILKLYTAGVLAEDERNQGYLKGLFKQIVIIASLNKESSQAVKAMINKIQTNQKLNKLLQSVQKSA